MTKINKISDEEIQEVTTLTDTYFKADLLKEKARIEALLAKFDE